MAACLNLRCRGRVVLDVLLDEGEELSVHGDDDAALAGFADGLADSQVEIDGGHDAVPELFVDQRLDRAAVVGDGLVGAVHVGLLEDLSVPAPHGSRSHLLQRGGGELRQELGQLGARGRLDLRLAQQQLTRV